MRRPTINPTISFIALAACAPLLLLCACAGPGRRAQGAQPPVQTARAVPTPPAVPPSDGFDYPVGRPARPTPGNDGDGWYNARDFGEVDHLGEDWNAETGGDTDCGLPVYAVSKGKIIFAGEAGPRWGKVVIIRHSLTDGAPVETLYGHLRTIEKTSGDVARREKIGSIGNADGAYLCHLHFELRLPDCPAWGAVGEGYGSDRAGWADPSEFIDAHRPVPPPAPDKVAAPSHPKIR